MCRSALSDVVLSSSTDRPPGGARSWRAPTAYREAPLPFERIDTHHPPHHCPRVSDDRPSPLAIAVHIRCGIMAELGRCSSTPVRTGSRSWIDAVARSRIRRPCPACRSRGASSPEANTARCGHVGHEACTGRPVIRSRDQGPACGPVHENGGVALQSISGPKAKDGTGWLRL